MDFKTTLNNLLFSKPIPNYRIPYCTKGRKIYPCMECGDKFIFQSSYEEHIKRKVILITFFCRMCSKKFSFKNRCSFLQHIRIHFSKTLTINYNDLSVELLPVEDLPILANKVQFFPKDQGSAPQVEDHSQTTPGPTKNTVSQPKPAPKKYYEVNSGLKKTSILTQQSDTAQNTVVPQAKNSETKQQCKNVSSQSKTSKGKLNCTVSAPKPPQTLNLEASDSQSHPKMTCMAFKCETCGGVKFDKVNQISTLRADHYKRTSDKLFKCPVCLCVLPNECAMTAHIKIHLLLPPFVCPECGEDIRHHTSYIQYPFSHACPAFRMMRLHARVLCPVINCKPFHPNDIVNHVKDNHLKMFFKCTECSAASCDKNVIYKHLTENHTKKTNATILFQCLVCEELLPNESLKNHILLSHSSKKFVYPCWNCGNVYNKVQELINHSKVCNINIKYNSVPKSASESNADIYQIHKRCGKCKKIFVYKCKHRDINILPDKCPFCVSKEKANEIKCPMCKTTVTYNTKDIKEHFALIHNVKIYPRVMLKPTTVSKKIKRKSNEAVKVITLDRNNIKPKRKKPNKKADLTPNETIKCNMCDYTGATKIDIEKHIISHRDPCAAYQCLECGQCFVVKGSFSTHLSVAHSISNVDEYINNKYCYNKEALKPHKEADLPKPVLKKNQCEICYEQFHNKEDLDKHFRVHGMAYLQKNFKEA